MKANLLLGLAALLALGGCAQRGLSPAAQSQNNAQILQMSFDESRSRSQRCLAGVAKNPSAQYVYANIIYENQNSPNKIELLASNAKLADSQRKYLLEYISLLQSCRQEVTANLVDYPSIIAALNRGYGDGDIIFADLLAKKITIGEANRQKVKLQARIQEEVTAAGNAIRNGYINQYNQDMNRQVAEDNNRRAIAASYLMNMQNNQTQQNIANQNQFNNNRPINTNCTRYGNQVNCTSQ